MIQMPPEIVSKFFGNFEKRPLVYRRYLSGAISANYLFLGNKASKDVGDLIQDVGVLVVGLTTAKPANMNKYELAIKEKVKFFS